MPQTYTSRAGVKQFKPSLKQLEKYMQSDECRGFCLACGKSQSGVEPDARKYVCENCNQPKVYGAEELVLMNLFY